LLFNIARELARLRKVKSMILWLQNRQSAGQSVIWTDVCLETRDYALAIRRESGSWAKSQAAANPSNYLS